VKLRHEIHNVVFRLLRRTENMRGERKADHADLVNRQGQVFVFHVLILSQVGRDGQHLLFLFFPLDTKGNLDATDGQEVKTANPLCLDQLGHVPILQDVVDARKGGERFFFFLFILAFILSYDIIAAAAFAAACNCRANDTT